MSTDSDQTTPPLKWIEQPPTAFDIVTGYYPESKPKAELRLRPCLVVGVLKGQTTGNLAIRIAYGTKNLKFVQRKDIDLIIQNHSDLKAIGLPMATRFNLDELIVLPWNQENFGCWRGYRHPVVGRLTQDYIKDFAYSMMIRQSNS